MQEREIELVYRSVAPYLSNLFKIQRFLEKHGHIERKKLIRRVEKRVQKYDGTLRTDYKILLNKLVETRQTGKDV